MTNVGLTECLLCALAGGGVGFLAGLFGVGGAFLLVPVLTIVLGFAPEIAVGAAACQTLGPVTTALLSRGVTVERLRFPLTISGGLLAGVLAGAELLALAKAQGSIERGARSVPVADIVVLSTYVLLLTTFGTLGVRAASRADEPVESGEGDGAARPWLLRVTIPPTCDVPDLGWRRVSMPMLVGLGLGMGLLAGFLGIGGGLVLIPVLTRGLGVDVKKAIATSLVVLWIVSCQATLVHAWQDHVDLAVVSSLLVGGTVGGRIGADIGVRWGGNRLHRAFGWLLLGTALFVVSRLTFVLWA